MFSFFLIVVTGARVGVSRGLFVVAWTCVFKVIERHSELRYGVLNYCD